ncbi:MAG: hypothetical protein KAS04_04550 [Candidatus Aenigmarchaeota archaeon]|nr:hypothetical protein [Candidatus Aenigmarchaeota archaeon]
MFDYWSVFSLVFIGFTVIGFLIYFMGNRKTRYEKMKLETYTCGEPFPEVSIGPDNFYVAIKKNLGIRNLRHIHSGKLSDYLLWFLIGLAALIFMVVML